MENMVRLLEGPSGPPSRPLPPALLLLSQSPWFSPWWFSPVPLLIGVHMPGRPLPGEAPTRKPGIQQPSTVSTENTEKLEKVAHPSQAKSWQEGGRQDGACREGIPRPSTFSSIWIPEPALPLYLGEFTFTTMAKGETLVATSSLFLVLWSLMCYWCFVREEEQEQESF